jgi:acid stress-induced BolA-like protein IbaG/YrbA
MSEKPSVTLTGMVEKVVKSPLSSEPDQAQIAIEGADHQYEAILIENTLTDKSGNKVQLRPGAEVKVTINAEPEAILFRS